MKEETDSLDDIAEKFREEIKQILEPVNIDRLYIMMQGFESDPHLFDLVKQYISKFEELSSTYHKLALGYFYSQEDIISDIEVETLDRMYMELLRFKSTKDQQELRHSVANIGALAKMNQADELSQYLANWTIRTVDSIIDTFRYFISRGNTEDFYISPQTKRSYLAQSQIAQAYLDRINKNGIS